MCCELANRITVLRGGRKVGATGRSGRGGAGAGRRRGWSEADDRIAFAPDSRKRRDASAKVSSVPG